MREDLVYVDARQALRRRGWQIVAGQPPRGSDHLPVVEIKAPLRTAKGSAGAFKPDLVAWCEPWLAIGECKPEPSLKDVLKLRAILADPRRAEELAGELRSRAILKTPFVLVAFVAHSNRKVEALPDLGTIVCSEGAEAILLPAALWPRDLAERFR